MTMFTNPCIFQACSSICLSAFPFWGEFTNVFETIQFLFSCIHEVIFDKGITKTKASYGGRQRPQWHIMFKS